MSDVVGSSAGPAPVSVHAVKPPPPTDPDLSSADEKTFLQLRRKVQEAELLSASTERLLSKIRFNGRLTVVVQNGRVLKSGYEEGYFRRKNDLSGILDS